MALTKSFPPRVILTSGHWVVEGPSGYRSQCYDRVYISIAEHRILLEQMRTDTYDTIAEKIDAMPTLHRELLPAPTDGGAWDGANYFPRNVANHLRYTAFKMRNPK